jgi:hypothetical protein
MTSASGKPLASCRVTTYDTQPESPMERGYCVLISFQIAKKMPHPTGAAFFILQVLI